MDYGIFIVLFSLNCLVTFPFENWQLYICQPKGEDVFVYFSYVGVSGATRATCASGRDLEPAGYEGGIVQSGWVLPYWVIFWCSVYFELQIG